MSTVVCVATSRGSFIAADTRRFDGTHLQPAELVVSPTKFIRFGDSLVGMTGFQVYENLLEQWSAKEPDLSTRKSVFSFFVTFMDTIQRQYHFDGDVEEKGSSFTSFDARFLVLNAGGIFCVDGDIGVTQYRHYWAIGSGCVFALGALHALYSEAGDPRELACRAVDAGIRFDPYSGGPIDVLEYVP